MADSTYDYIVVGAGSAGCAVACRLVEGGATVALLEAGPKDTSWRIHVPAALRPAMPPSFTVTGPRLLRAVEQWAEP